MVPIKDVMLNVYLDIRFACYNETFRLLSHILAYFTRFRWIYVLSWSKLCSHDFVIHYLSVSLEDRPPN